MPVAGIALVATIASWDWGLDDGLGGERARKATWLIERGSYREARAYAATAVKDLPHPGVFHFRVGEALIAAGQYVEAIDELRAALAIDRGQPAIQLALGQALLLGGRPDDAIPHVKAAVDADFRPEVSAPWLIRALAAAGKDDEAVRWLRAVPDPIVNAAGAETELELGSLALELKIPDAAERWLRAAAGRNANSAEAMEKLGVSVLLQRRPAEAVAPLERACQLAPSNASARLNLAVAYAQLERFGEARAAAREAMRLDASEPRAAALLEALSRERR
jgi:tetratricopeptide (TPR) repeat protein